MSTPGRRQPLLWLSLYVSVPNVFLDAQRHVHVRVTLLQCGDQHVRATADWTQLNNAAALPHYPVSAMPLSVPPGVEILIPGNVLNDPIYICVRQLHSQALAKPVLIAVFFTDQNRVLKLHATISPLPPSTQIHTPSFCIGPVPLPPQPAASAPVRAENHGSVDPVPKPEPSLSLPVSFDRIPIPFSS